MSPYQSTETITHTNPSDMLAYLRYDGSTADHIKIKINRNLDKVDMSLIHTTLYTYYETYEEHDNLGDEIGICLVKLYHDFQLTDELNSEENRKIAFKERESKVDAQADFREKLRLFSFRIFYYILFIIVLFTVGNLEDKYTWAKLPLAKYISGSKLPIK